MAPRPVAAGAHPRAEKASPRRVGRCARLEAQLNPPTRSGSGASAHTYHSGRGAHTVRGAGCRTPCAPA
eukprot:6231750-Alexandrium_andersonii.AAC.1